jgi:hypothetical protein
MAITLDLITALVGRTIRMPPDDGIHRSLRSVTETVNVTLGNGLPPIPVVDPDHEAPQKHQYSMTALSVAKMMGISTNREVDVTIKKTIGKVVLQKTENDGSIQLTRSIFSTLPV